MLTYSHETILKDGIDKINTKFSEVYPSKRAYEEFKLLGPIRVLDEYSDELVSLPGKTYRFYHTSITHDGVKKEDEQLTTLCFSPSVAADRLIQQLEIWVEKELASKKPPYILFWRVLPEIKPYTDFGNYAGKLYYGYARLLIVGG